MINYQGAWVFIQARYNSTRLKGKVLKSLSGKKLLKWVVERANNILPSNNLAVLTGRDDDNRLIVDWCEKEKINCFKGSENDVLNRFVKASKYYNAKNIIRLTADNPLLDFNFSKTLLKLHIIENANYSSSKSETGSGLPAGIGTEIFNVNTLNELDSMNLSISQREHVNDYILENPSEFKFLRLGLEMGQKNQLSFTIDTNDDWKVIERLISNSKPQDVSLSDYWKLVTQNKNIIQS
mgnify:CR=1 FL=1